MAAKAQDSKSYKFALAASRLEARTISLRANHDQRVTAMIKKDWLESSELNGYRKVTGDLSELD